MGATSADLAAIEVLIVDCQATAARGRLIEIGWARVSPGGPVEVASRLVALPEGERLPRRVAEITGLTDAMLREGVPEAEAFRALLGEPPPAGPLPTVIHYAQFEAPFLADLARGAAVAPPFDVVCVHAIARRLLPELPRRTLRALAGYFGMGVAAPRRAAEHVEATAFVWRSLLPLLAEQEGVRTWAELRAFLGSRAPRSERRAYPMPRETRLAAPDRPGLYRMLRLDGSVLYVGKATSLRARVNSYFRRQSGGPDRTLEMLSQARGLSFTVTESALEAALAEPDEIKLHRPQYNVALLEGGRSLWFATRDLRAAARAPDRRHAVGPMVTPDLVRGLAALSGAISRGEEVDPARILAVPARFAPSREVTEAGIALFLEAHPEARGGGVAALIALGARLWHLEWDEAPEDEAEPEDEAGGREGTVDEARAMPEAAPEDVARGLTRVVVLGAHALRRARWIVRLVDCAVSFAEPSAARVLVIERGEVVHRATVAPGAPAPVPPGAARSWADRRRALGVASFDRLRVLTTELRRIVAEGHAAEIRFGPGRALSGARLTRALSWI